MIALATLCALLGSGGPRPTTVHLETDDASVSAMTTDATAAVLDAGDEGSDPASLTADGEQEDAEARGRTTEPRPFTTPLRQHTLARTDTYRPQFDLPPESRVTIA